LIYKNFALTDELLCLKNFLTESSSKSGRHSVRALHIYIYVISRLRGKSLMPCLNSYLYTSTRNIHALRVNVCLTGNMK